MIKIIVSFNTHSFINDYFMFMLIDKNLCSIVYLNRQSRQNITIGMWLEYRMDVSIDHCINT